MLVPITKDATATCISLQDPAIDIERSQKADDGTPVYLRERLRNPSSWRESVTIKDGATPTVFVIGVVPSSELNHIEDDCVGLGKNRGNELGWRCFMHGLRKIQGMGQKVVTRELAGVEYVDPQWIADVFVGPLRNIAVEIGNIIFAWNNVSPEDTANLSGRSKHTTASSA